MKRVQFLAGLLALVAASIGCRHRAALNTYRLLRQNGRPVLVPPGVSPDLTRRTLVANIAAGMGTCAIDGGGAIRLQPRKKKVRLTVNRDVLLKQQQPGWLADWSIRAEVEGCIAPGLGHELGNLIVESVPLDPDAAFRLLHANDILRGYVDLGPENRLQVYSPIPREGTTAKAPAPEISKISGTGYRLDVDLKTAPGHRRLRNSVVRYPAQYRTRGVPF